VRIEEVIEAAPEVILLPDEPYEFREEDLPDFLKHPEIPAVENDRIHFIDGKITAWFGPRIGEGLVVVCNLLSPY
jgi:ABC-type hemin transport system substrate-binding protein